MVNKCGFKQNFQMYCPLLNEFYLEDPKKRRLEAWEMNKNGKQITKHGLTKNGGKCKEVGHNLKSCPQQP